MNDDRVTSLVSELIAFDESLKDHEADLRILVSHMMEEKPAVVADETFARDLRARLLSNHVRGILSPYQKAERWAFRLVPLGVVALLVLMLLPERTHYLPLRESTDTLETQIKADDERVVSVGNGDGDTSRSMPVSDLPYGGGGDMSAMDTALAPEETQEGVPAPKMMTMEAPVTPPPFIVNPQPRGPRVVIDEVTVTSPSFVVLYVVTQDGGAHVFGVSPLINLGTTNNLPIYTKSPTRTDGSYFGMLYTDNGNRLFTESEDVPFTDPYGNPVIVTIVIE